MKAIDFLKSKGITKATCYTEGRTYYVDGLAELMEEYAALRQCNVSGRSEQFYCVSSNALVHGKPCEKWCGDENCKALCKQ